MIKAHITEEGKSTRHIPPTRVIYRLLDIADTSELENLYRSFLPRSLSLSKADWSKEHELIESFAWFGVRVSSIHFLPLTHYERSATDNDAGKAWQYFWTLYYNRIGSSMIDNGLIYDRCRGMIDRIIGSHWPAHSFSEPELHEMIGVNRRFNYLGYSIGMLLSEFLVGYTFAQALDWNELAKALKSFLEAFRRGHYLKHISDDNTALMMCSQLPE